ncbi:MAG: phosphatase PAP2 family protein [Acidobacteria bacterium]|nr:phosphatase PAP2 family protein [Acidobacteriota bacterium]MBI3421352.1 phosphatase PAP2 family protein [Acidobacteriota bacterium]
MLNPIAEFDRTFSLWVHSRAQPWLDAWMSALTRGGEPRTLLLFALLCGAFLLIRQRRKRDPALLLLAFSLSYLINPQLKLFFQRARPQLWDTLIVRPGDYSFPSGHATSSMAVYGMVALLLAQAWPRWRWYFWLSAALLISLIGFSRVYLGVHWLTDVLGGFMLGGALVYAIAFLIRHSNKHNAK